MAIESVYQPTLPDESGQAAAMAHMPATRQAPQAPSFLTKSTKQAELTKSYSPA
jgi:hypothetical protein